MARLNEAHRLEAFGCVVWAEADPPRRDSLLCCELGEWDRAGGTIAAADEAGVSCEVCAPEHQAFLDAVNDKLETEYRFDQFAGR
jgi:hypothetical protein